jgi:hypothetical protein
MEKITGTPLLGFDDAFGADRGAVLGAAGGPLKSPAKPWKPSPINKARAAKLHPVHAIPVAVKSAKSSIAKLRKATTSLAAVKKKPHKIVVLGAAPAHPTTKKPLTPRQQAAVTKYNNAAKKAQHAAIELHAAAAKTAHAIVALHSQIKKTKAAITPAHLHGFGDTDLLGLDVLGADPDPNNPGFLTDGSPDPNWTNLDPNLQPALDDPTLNTDPPPDVPPVQAPPIETIVATVPPDGIVYDGTQGFPRYSVGSASSFYGPNTNKSGAETDSGGMYGWLWGWNHWNDPFKNKGETAWIIRSGEAGLSADQAAHAAFNPVAGIATLIAKGNDNWSDSPNVPATDPSQLPDVSATLADFDAAGMKYPDGVTVSMATNPFVGGPGGPLKNLRWATQDKKWFWYLSEAPDAYTAASRYAAQALAKAQADADAAAAALQAKQDAQALAAAAAAQAQQDAQNALAESAATSAQTVADAGVQTAQSQADAATITAQQQAEQFNQQQDIEAAKASQSAAIQQAQQPGGAAVDEGDDGVQDAEYTEEGGGEGGEEDGGGAPEAFDEEIT